MEVSRRQTLDIDVLKNFPVGFLVSNLTAYGKAYIYQLYFLVAIDCKTTILHGASLVEDLLSHCCT